MAERCEQCLAEGITLLPFRWGYRFKEKKLSVKGRILREGYIYILDNNGEWYGYVVSQGRYLKQFDVQNTEKTSDLPIVDYTCHKGDNCTILDSFIRIPNPNKDIETLWCAYSPVKWTKAVIERHENNINDAKARNMIEVSVSATQSKNKDSLNTSSQKAGNYNLWRYDPDGEGEKPVTKYLATEYLGYINPFTKQPYNPDKSNEKENLKIELSKIEESGNRVLSVYFNDAVGKMLDLNDFMIDVEAGFIDTYSVKESDNKQLKHKIEVAHLINNLERSIKEGAKTDAVNRYIHKKVSPRSTEYTNRVGAMGHIEEINYENYTDILKNTPLTPSERSEINSEANHKAEKAWEDYLKLYNKSEMDSFLNYGMGKTVEEDYNKTLKMLIDAHQDIYSGKDLIHQLHYNFDTADVASGVAYTENVFESIGVTVNYPECIERYADDISDGSLQQESSCLLRALVYNHQPLIDTIVAESEKKLPWHAMTQAAWSAAFNGGAAIYAANVVKRSVIAQNAISQLTSPVLKIINTQTGKPSVSEATFAIGFFLEKRITRIEFRGTRGQAVQYLSDLLDKQNTVASKQTINKFSVSIINQLKAEGKADFKSNINGHMLALLDLDKVPTALNNLEFVSPADISNWVGSWIFEKIVEPDVLDAGTRSTVISNQRVQDIHANSSKNYMNPLMNLTGTPNKQRAAVIAGNIFQAAACISLLHAAVTGSESTQSNELAKFIENSEGWTKLAAGLGFLVGGHLDNQASKLRMQLTNPDLPENSAKVKKVQLEEFGKWSKGINVGSGFIFAAFDFYHAYDELTKANRGMAGLYTVSAITGFGSVVLIGSEAMALGTALSWNAIGWALLAISIGVGILIAIVANNPLEEWVENSIWGNDAINKNDYKKDILEYENALKKMVG